MTNGGNGHGAESSIPTKYLPAIIGAVIGALISGGGVTLNNRTTIDPIVSDLANLHRDMDVFRDKQAENRDLVVKHESEIPALDKRVDSFERAHTDALRAINQQLDYLLKNAAVRR